MLELAGSLGRGLVRGVLRHASECDAGLRQRQNGTERIAIETRANSPTAGNESHEERACELGRGVQAARSRNHEPEEPRVVGDHGAGDIHGEAED